MNFSCFWKHIQIQAFTCNPYRTFHDSYYSSSRFRLVHMRGVSPLKRSHYAAYVSKCIPNRHKHLQRRAGRRCVALTNPHSSEEHYSTCDGVLLVFQNFLRSPSLYCGAILHSDCVARVPISASPIWLVALQSSWSFWQSRLTLVRASFRWWTAEVEMPIFLSIALLMWCVGQRESIGRFNFSSYKAHPIHLLGMRPLNNIYRSLPSYLAQFPLPLVLQKILIVLHMPADFFFRVFCRFSSIFMARIWVNFIVIISLIKLPWRK